MRGVTEVVIAEIEVTTEIEGIIEHIADIIELIMVQETIDLAIVEMLEDIMGIEIIIQMKHTIMDQCIEY